uniref:BTB domain-containing protein n=1 Tax=Panagrolaimus superbus TaxID=310955 RepID=A0A914ZB47_9BILA
MYHGAGDIKFVVGSESITAHQFFISLESNAFKAMFENPLFKENQSGEILIDDFQFQTVQAFVLFSYGHDIGQLLEYPENGMELLRFADKYDIKNLMETLEEFYLKKITKYNVSFLLSPASRYNAGQLREGCLKFIQALPQADQSCIAFSGAEEMRDLLEK